MTLCSKDDARCLTENTKCLDDLARCLEVPAIFLTDETICSADSCILLDPTSRSLDHERTSFAGGGTMAAKGRESRRTTPPTSRETFLAHARETYEAPLPRYVEQELRGNLRLHRNGARKSCRTRRSPSLTARDPRTRSARCRANRPPRRAPSRSGRS